MRKLGEIDGEMGKLMGKLGNEWGNWEIDGE